jgi:hypothetical protein
MSTLRLTYPNISVGGAAVPMSHVVACDGADGWSHWGLAAAWNGDAAAGLFPNLKNSAGLLKLWLSGDCMSRRNWLSLLAVRATYLVGLTWSMPLDPFLRARPD